MQLEDFPGNDMGSFQELEERLPHQFNNHKFTYVERLTPADSSRSGVSADISGLGHGDRAGEKEFFSSVLPDSAWNSGPAPTGL